MANRYDDAEFRGTQLNSGVAMSQLTDRNIEVLPMPEPLPDDVQELVNVAIQLCSHSVRGASEALQVLLNERPDLRRRQPLRLVGLLDH